MLEIMRTTKSGGKVGFSTWKTLGWIDSLNVAVKRVDPSLKLLSDPKRIFHEQGWCDEQWIEKYLQDVGFQNVQCELVPADFIIDDPKIYADTLGKMPMTKVLMKLSGWTEDEQKLEPKLQQEMLKYLEEKVKAGSPERIEMLAIVSLAQKP